MSTVEHEGGEASIVGRAIGLAIDGDGRLRATWRVMLAWPVLWILTGGVLTGNLQAMIDVIPSGGGLGAGLAQSILHAGFLVVVLVGWARFLDRRPLSSYGFAASRRWLRAFLVGFGAVAAGYGFWVALGTAGGWKTVEVSLADPGGSFLFAAAGILAALLLHAAVQQVVFFRVVLGDAVEGLRSRGVSARAAGVGALCVAIAIFVAMHGEATPLRLLDLAVAGAVYGLLFLHTGDLGLGVGAHFGALAAGSVLYSSSATGPAVLRVSGSFPGPLGTVTEYGFLGLVVAYLLVLAWLVWWRDGASIGS